ncbi:MAG: MBL fold metallo-hydrolase [Candidatus Nanohaloarchaea archaeon]|nr:MBL fold metallo-hydrolase [Candidatus Nanohaloarchaea archaeon]
MKLTVLGSGSCVVKQGERSSSAYVLEIGSRTFMIDSGTGSLKNLPETDYSVEDLDGVISTHRHPDHISDLVPLVQDKLVRSFEKDENDILILGPEGHREYLIDRIHHEMAENIEDFNEKFGFELKIDELRPQQVFKTDDVRVEVQQAEHGPEDFECLSVRVSSGENTVVFTGDTDYHEQLVDFSENADILVTDCSRPSGKEIDGHMNAEQCGKLAERANVNKLVLSHLYPQAEAEDVGKQASEVFGGAIVVAEDFLEIR